MTLAEFYATHASAQAIIVPRRAIRSGSPRRPAGTAIDTEHKSSASAATPADGADKKH